MNAIRTVNPLLRAILVISGVAVLVAGTTFAALSDNATLVGNTMSSDTADLQVSNGGAFGDRVQGFAAEDIVPGVGKTFPFYLANGSDFDMNVEVSVPDKTCTDIIGTASGITNCSQIEITFTDLSNASGDSETYTLQQLINSPRELPGNVLLANSQGSGAATLDEGDYEVTFDFKPGGVSGSSVSTAPFDLEFSGEQAPVAP